MKRAKQLLEASKIMMDITNQKESSQYSVVAYLFAICIIVCTIMSTQSETVNIKKAMDLQFKAIQCSALMMGLNIIRTLYTGFTEDKRIGSKNSFKQFAIQLPVIKEDFMRAQFIDSMTSILPSIIALGFMIIANIVKERNTVMYVYTGLGVMIFLGLVIIQGVERGISNYKCFNMPLKYCFYVCTLAIIVICVLSTKGEGTHFILSMQEKSNWLVSFSRFFGGFGGICSMLLGIMLNYICTLKVPHLMCKLGGEYEET